MERHPPTHGAAADKQPQERRVMKDAIIELTRAVNRLADGLGEVIDRLDLIAEVVKEGKEKNPPCTPLKEKAQEKLPSARARGKLFTKPTVEEVAAYIKAKGYTFDAEQFWNFYESNGWYVGRRKMKSWQSACVTWQKRNGNGPRPLTIYERKRTEFELEAEAIAARKSLRRGSGATAIGCAVLSRRTDISCVSSDTFWRSFQAPKIYIVKKS